MPKRRSLVVAAFVGLVGIVGCGSDDPKGEGPADEFSGRAAHWVEVEAPPLDARAHTVGVWTGTEVLLVGGDTFMCPPTADCTTPTDPPLADAVAYDPSTDQWRHIAPPSLPFAEARTAVVGDEVFFLTLGAFQAYSVADDAWRYLPQPESVSWGQLVAAGDRIVLVPTSDEEEEAPDLVFDPETNAWTELPPDPLGPAYDRTMVWSGAHLYLFDHELVANPGSERPSLTRAARLALDSLVWERLPDSEILGTEPWLVDGSVLLNPTLGSADGGEVNGWGRSYPEGGVFDTESLTWSTLPPAPAECCSAGALGSTGAWYRATSGLLLDRASGSWIELPMIPGDNRSTERTLVTAGADAFVFGGVRWDARGGGDLLSDAWIWKSGGR